jgi:hypothetical protein
MLKRAVTTLAFMFACTGTACAADMSVEPPGGDYAKVSSLVELPDFIPGLGTLYVQPATLPAGPFLAYDRNDRLVSTIFMIPLEDMRNEKRFDGLELGGESVQNVDMYFNAGHPGVPNPHYHIVLWHVDPQTAELE